MGSIPRQRVRVTVSKDKMAATMVVKPPEPGESQITVDEVMAAVESADVGYGIQYDIILQCVTEKIYDVPLRIATGIPPQDGEPAVLEYFFETDAHRIPSEDKDGRIDYRNLNFIQNVEKGAILAQKSPPTPGTNGKGVDGTEIPAAKGRDFSFKASPNTRISDDGLRLMATADGAVVCQRGIIEVKDLLVIRGDVDYSVGNIDCTGSVRVVGSVRAGFRLNIGGNLEIYGNVEDCHITCKGNILIRGGCIGEVHGCIRAEGDIVVKYAEGQKIVSGRDVIISGELLNCQVTAKERVWVKGEKGRIIGGEINAGREIRASIIGTGAGAPTVLTVAFDRDLMRLYHETVHEIARLIANQERVRAGLNDLLNRKKDGRFSRNQLLALKKLKEFQHNLPEALTELNSRRAEIEERLRQFKDAAIIADDTIYPGVEAHFGAVYRQITNVRNQCKLTRDGKQIVICEYCPSRSHIVNSVETP